MALRAPQNSRRALVMAAVIIALAIVAVGATRPGGAPSKQDLATDNLSTPGVRGPAGADLARDIAAAFGRASVFDGAMLAATDSALRAARGAVDSRRLVTARRLLWLVEKRYDDPRPNARRAVVASIGRAERQAQRARERGRDRTDDAAPVNVSPAPAQAPAAAATDDADPTTDGAGASSSAGADEPAGTSTPAATQAPAKPKPTGVRSPEFF
jgi:hypothetical protein